MQMFIIRVLDSCQLGYPLKFMILELNNYIKLRRVHSPASLGGTKKFALKRCYVIAFYLDSFAILKVQIN